MAECLTPITLHRKNRGRRNNHTDVVPCGRCPNCLKKRQQQWIFRLQREQEIAKTSAFITFTYDDDHLPFSENGYPDLNRRHHQNFMKRLRKYLHENRFKYKITPNTKLKYYMCGEYGDQSGRPHYHSILFNLPRELIEDQSHIERLWGHGGVQVAVCNVKTIAYVTKYIDKRLYKNTQDGLDDRELEYSAMSKRLGSNWITDAKIKHYKKYKRPYIVVEDGKKLSMPRYYKEKIYAPWEQAIIATKSKEYADENYSYRDSKHEIEHKQLVINQHRKKNNAKRIKH